MWTRQVTLMLSIALSAWALPTPAGDAISLGDTNAKQARAAEGEYGKYASYGTYMGTYANYPGLGPPHDHQPETTTYSNSCTNLHKLHRQIWGFPCIGQATLLAYMSAVARRARFQVKQPEFSP
ncbi:hypothetical protein BST61_g1622 [Cercospora zeina]